MKFIKREKGFTLIELLVVIAIIGILSTVVVSSLSNARDKSKIAALSQELPQLRTALELYHLDYNNYNLFEGLTRVDSYYDFDWATGEMIEVSHETGLTYALHFQNKLNKVMNGTQ
jgi:prepilin-type N-terminal cleavage/methylation domain-containing protein